MGATRAHQLLQTNLNITSAVTLEMESYRPTDMHIHFSQKEKANEEVLGSLAQAECSLYCQTGSREQEMN